MNELKFDKWVTYPNGAIYPSDTITVDNELKSGIYKISFDDQRREYFLMRNDFIHDDLIFHQSDEYKIIMDEIQSFWNLKQSYQENNYVHKRGLLLAGSPGTGKTSLINLTLDWFFKEIKGIVFTISDYHQLMYYSGFHKSRLRKIQPDIPIICIFEDIDGYISAGNDGESILLNILDGNNQIANVMYIATTNYPEKLTERLSRPGRFDVKVEIKFPSRKEREIYIVNKLGNIENLSKWLDNTENKSFAFISEMVKQSKIYNQDLEIILDKLDTYAKIAKSSASFNKEEKAIGFQSPSPRKY